MIISDPVQMEKIVARNRNLIWDNGWDVLSVKRSPTAFFYADGRLIKGKWYRTKRYTLSRQGWTIPDDIIKA